MLLTRNEKQRLRTSKSARRKKQLSHHFQLHETDQFHSRPITQLENISVDMNRRPESVNPRSANDHFLNPQFNYYNNPYLQRFSNYRTDKQEIQLKREHNHKNNDNSFKNIQKVSANDNTIEKEVLPQSSIQDSSNTNCKNQKGSQVKKETKYTDTIMKDAIDEELQLIHGYEINKDCETSAKHFNINTRLSYLENYPVKTSDFTRAQKPISNVVQSTKSTTEDIKVNKDIKQPETNNRTNTAMEKNSDKSKLHEVVVTHGGDEHNTNNNSKVNQIVLNTYIKTGEGLDTHLHNILKITVPTNVGAAKSKKERDKLVKISAEDFKKPKWSKLSIKTNSCKIEETCSSELTEKKVEPIKISLEKSSNNTLKLSKATKKIHCKDEVETKESFRKRKKNVESCPIIVKYPKIVGDKLSSGSNDLIKQSVSLESDRSLKKCAKISNRRKTVSLPSECDINSSKVFVFKTMEDKRGFDSVNVTNPKLDLDSTNGIGKHAKISKRRMTVSVPLEPVVSLVNVSKYATDKSTPASVDIIKQNLNLDSTDTVEKLSKISKRRKTITSPLEADIDVVKVSKALWNKSLSSSVDVLKENTIDKLSKNSKRGKTVTSPLEADIDSVKVSKTLGNKSLFGSVDETKEKLTSNSTNSIRKCGSISHRRKTVTVSTNADSDLTKTTANTITELSAVRNKRSNSVDVKGATVTIITRSKSKELKCADVKGANSKQSNRNLLDNQTVSSNSDKKHPHVEATKRVSKTGRPKKIPHTPKEENMPDPRLRKSEESRMLPRELDNSKVHLKKNSVTDKIRNHRKSMSEDALNFLFGEEPHSNKKKVNCLLSNSKSTTTWNLKELDPYLTNSKPTTSKNVNELDVSNEQLNIFFKIHNAPLEELSAYAPETTSDLAESDYSQLLVKATETNHISTTGTAITSYTPKVLNDQKVVIQMTKPNLNQIVQNVGDLVRSEFVSASNTINNKSAGASINLNIITHDMFIKEFYCFIYMYCDTYYVLSERVKMFQSHLLPQPAISKEVHDFVLCFREKMRRFIDSLSKYFETRLIATFSCKTLIWRYNQIHFKQTGRNASASHILNFFYTAVKDIRNTREPTGFLKVFCEDIEKAYADSISTVNVQAHQQPPTQRRPQNHQHQPRQQRQSLQNASVPQQTVQPQNQSFYIPPDSQKQQSQNLPHQQIQIPQRVLQPELQQPQKLSHPLLQPSHRVVTAHSLPEMSQKLLPPPPYSHVQNNPSIHLPPSSNRSKQIEKLPATPQYSETQHNRMQRPMQQPGKHPYSQSRSESTEVNDNRFSLTPEQRNCFLLQCQIYNYLIKRHQLLLQPRITTSMPTSTTSITNSSSSNVPSPNTSIYSNLQTYNTGLLSNVDHIQTTTDLQSTVTQTTRDNTTILHNFNNNVNSFESNTSTLLNNDVSNRVEQVPASSNSTDTTDNFKIRLPLAQPREEKISSTSNISLTTNCNTETLACNSTNTIDSDQKPKIEALRDEEIIDVEEWFNNSLRSSEIIDLDCYFLDDEIKNEEPVNVQSETSNVNTMDVNPRIGSVDSGLAHSPSQIEHPDVLSGERLCICSKVAELMCSCGKAIYCSTDCQRTDWQNHKVQCVRRFDVSSSVNQVQNP